MSSTQQQTQEAGAQQVDQYDVIIIGAGVTGLYQLYKIKQLGLSVRLYEDGSGVGGTWYWNRYPGCRFDSETESYAYSWSEELLQEWDWKEHYSGQPENERYLNYVTDKFDLRQHIQFNSRVASAIYDESENRWDVRLEDGQRARAQHLIAAVGILSAHYLPPFEGLDSFQGEWFHTGKWPKEGLDLTGKRVGVVGTGATGIQLIPEIAKEVGHLTVFQRTPNYTAPLRNSEISDEEQIQFKATYPEIFKRCEESPTGFLWQNDPRSALEVSEEERLATFEDLWSKPGFSKWLGNFSDIMVSREANETFAEFVRNKIRERVHDPVVAEMLTPKDYPFGAKRVPMETGYYEAFNRANVLLVDVHKAPIERITPKGIKTSDAEYEFDIIIFATGYDAITGSVVRMDIRGEGGQTIKDKWADGPRNYLTLQSNGFPNLFFVTNTAFCNYTRCAEKMVEWVSDCISYMRENEYGRIEATLEAEDAWTRRAAELVEGSLITESNAWWNGANIDGKSRTFLLYGDSAPNYRAQMSDAAANGYEGFVLK